MSASSFRVMQQSQLLLPDGLGMAFTAQCCKHLALNQCRGGAQ